MPGPVRRGSFDGALARSLGTPTGKAPTTNPYYDAPAGAPPELVSVGADGFYRANTPQQKETLLASGVDPSKILTVNNAGRTGLASQYYTGTDPNAIHTEERKDTAGNPITIQVYGDGRYNDADPMTRAYWKGEALANKPGTGFESLKYVAPVVGGVIGGAVGGPGGAVAGASLGSGLYDRVIKPAATITPTAKVYGEAAIAGIPAGGTGGTGGAPNTQMLSGFQAELSKQIATNGPTAAPTVNRTGTTVAGSQGYTAPQITNNAGYVAPRAAPAQGYTAPTAAPAQGYEAPRADPAQGYTAGQAGFTGYNASTAAYAPTVTAGEAVAGRVTPTFIGTPGAIRAPVINTPDRISANQVVAERINPVQAAAPERVAATSIERQMLDRQNADQSRSQFQDALAKIKIAAEGGAPSAAEELLRKGIDENVSTAMGMAASLQGRNPGVALRVGAANAREAITKSSADMAALRASEQATARGQLGEFTKALNSNDIQQGGLQLAADVDVAKSNAFNLLDAAKSNQSAGVQTAVANLNAMVDVLKSNQMAALSAGQSNAANDLQAKIENLRAVIQVSTSNATMNLTAQINNIQNQIEVAKSNQATALAAGQTNAVNETNASIATLNAKLQAAVANMNMIKEVNISNAGFMNDAARFQADAYNKTQQFNVNEQNTALRFGAEQTNTTNRYNTGLQADALRFSAGEANTTSRFNAGLSADAMRFSAGEANTTDRFNTGLSADAMRFTAGEEGLNTRANASLSANALQFGAEQAGVTDRFNATTTANQNQWEGDAALRQQVINDARAQGFRDDQITLLLAQAGFGERAVERSDRLGAANDAKTASYIQSFGTILGNAYNPLNNGPSNSYTGSGGSIPSVDFSTGIRYGANGAPILV